MNSQRLNGWLTLAANIGVIGGLVLVALELSQTTDAIRGATYQAGAESSADWNKWVVETEGVMATAIKFNESGLDALTEEERITSISVLSAAFRRHDSAFYQYELGLLTDEYYNTVFRADMETWVPRWRDWGLLDDSESYISRAMRPSFRAEIEKYLDAPRTDAAAGR